MDILLTIICLILLKIIYVICKYQNLPFGPRSISLREWHYNRPTIKDPYRWERYEKQYKRFF